MKRIQFVVEDSVYKTLEDLRERTGATSLAGVFRDALRAYAWIVSEFANRREVVSRPFNAQTRVFSQLATLFSERSAEQGEIQAVSASESLDKIGELSEEQTARLMSAFEAGKDAMREAMRRGQSSEEKEAGEAR